MDVLVITSRSNSLGGPVGAAVEYQMYIGKLSSCMYFNHTLLPVSTVVIVTVFEYSPYKVV